MIEETRAFIAGDTLPLGAKYIRGDKRWHWGYVELADGTRYRRPNPPKNQALTRKLLGYEGLEDDELDLLMLVVAGKLNLGTQRADLRISALLLFAVYSRRHGAGAKEIEEALQVFENRRLKNGKPGASHKKKVARRQEEKEIAEADPEKFNLPGD